MKKLLSVVIISIVLVATIASCSAILSGSNSHAGHSPAAECC